MADTRWGLKEDVVDDIKRTFVGSANLYRRLGTSNKIWDAKIVARTGVKEVTARQLALEFLRLLRNVHTNSDNERGINRDIAHNMYSRYAVAVGASDPTELIEIVVENDAEMTQRIQQLKSVARLGEK